MFGLNKTQMTIAAVIALAVIVYLIFRMRKSQESGYSFGEANRSWKPFSSDKKDQLRAAYNWMPPTYPYESGFAVPAFYNNAVPVDMSRMFVFPKENGKESGYFAQGGCEG